MNDLNLPGYQILRELGSGSLARVYLAREVAIDRPVAVKVMAADSGVDPNFSARFEREVRAIAGLGHSNIAPVYAFGTTAEQQHYLVMPYLAGGTLRDRLAQGLTETEWVRILVQIARALAYAHGRGVVHRSLSSRNILFDDSGRPLLTDFALSRTRGGLTGVATTTTSLEKSYYLSPEQARGVELDHRTDLYSLGVIAYEGLLGQPPFLGAAGFAVAYAHVFEPPPRLPQALAHWQPVLDRALAKNPEERYPDAEQFAAALQAIPIDKPRRVPLRGDSADVAALLAMGDERSSVPSGGTSILGRIGTIARGALARPVVWVSATLGILILLVVVGYLLWHR